MLGQTPSQTVGPFFAHALTPAPDGCSPVAGNRLAEGLAGVPLIRIEGQVTDGAGAPVTDAMVEIWQADDRGRFENGTRGFRGFGRASTDALGGYWFETVKPGRPTRETAPHISVAVFARGMLNHAFSRIYFSDEEAANTADPVYSAVAPERRSTLVASRLDREGKTIYRYDLRLQGDRETVFFDA